MANKNSNKISIKPMNNAAAIASTLGISASSAAKDEQLTRKTSDAIDNSQNTENTEQSAAKSQTKSAKSGSEIQSTNDKASVAKKSREVAVTTPKFVPQASQAVNIGATTASQPTEMPLLIEIKRKFPGKELYILSLLYLQRNNRGLVQMTVGSMMALYSSVFQDVIKDDTARRSLKRLYDAGFIKTTSIPGNNSGYIYEIGDLLETESLSAAEKEEFSELIEFVKSKLNNAAI
jgi:hypothetical protein